MNPRRRISLFAKTAWLAAAVSVLAAGLLVFFAAAIHDRAAFSHRAGGARLAAELARRCGPDPTAENIAFLAKEHGVDLRYRSPRLSFATDASLPDFNEVRIRKHHRRRGIAMAHGGGWLVALHRGDGRALMVGLGKHGGPWRDAFDDAFDIISVLAAGVVFLWLAFYFLQRKMLSPLSKLRDDMEAVSAGEWRETKISQNDEIGDLAAVFNEMQRRLRAMVQSKERLLIDASHELRSPLARLRLAAEFVKDEKLRAKIAADIAELEELTGGILETSRIQNAAAPKKSSFSAAALFQTLREKYPRAQFGGAPAAAVCGDFSALARAFGNLLDNAQKFAAAEVRVVGEFQNGELLITVEDDGPGAAAADLPHLFEPFYRADISRSRDTGGFGLGLSIARAAITAHGGAISAKNKTPHGLAVSVRIPAQAE